MISDAAGDATEKRRDPLREKDPHLLE